jgi:hypothetical protein
MTSPENAAQNPQSFFDKHPAVLRALSHMTIGLVRYPSPRPEYSEQHVPDSEGMITIIDARTDRPTGS